jgi:hypothetical protein
MGRPPDDGKSNQSNPSNGTLSSSIAFSPDSFIGNTLPLSASTGGQRSYLGIVCTIDEPVFDPTITLKDSPFQSLPLPQFPNNGEPTMGRPPDIDFSLFGKTVMVTQQMPTVWTHATIIWYDIIHHNQHHYGSFTDSAALATPIVCHVNPSSCLQSGLWSPIDSGANGGFDHDDTDVVWSVVNTVHLSPNYWAAAVSDLADDDPSKLLA